MNVSMFRLVLLSAILLFFSAESFGATPSTTNLPPDTALVGEEFCYDTALSNTGTTGYGPYLRVIYGPGLTLQSAAFLGSSISVTQVGTFSSPSNELEDPIIEETVSGSENYAFSVLSLPIGSVVTDGPSIDTTLCFVIDASATPATEYDISIAPVYELGDSANGDNGPVVGSTVDGSVEASIYSLSTSSSGAEKELAAGPSVQTTVTHTLDVANGPTVASLQFSDVLDSSVQYAGQATISGGTNCTIGSEPSQSTPGGTLDISCDDVTGTQANNDVVVSYPMYFVNELDSQQCAVQTVTHEVTFDAQYPAGTPLTQQSSSDSVSLKHLAIQQSVSDEDVSPGNLITVTNNVQVSDYISVDGFVMSDVLPDGIDLDTDVTIVHDGNTYTVTPSTSTDSFQNTTLTYDVAAQTGTLAGGETVVITYSIEIQQTYVGGYQQQDSSVTVDSNAPLLANDILGISQSSTYDIASGAEACVEDSSSSMAVVGVTTKKKLLDSSDNETDTVLEFAPGDEVTYRLHMDIPSGDTNAIVFTDFLPLPVFAASGIDTTSSIASNTNFAYGPNNTLSIDPTITTDADTNSVTLNWGDVSAETAEVLEVDLTVTVSEEPFSDNLTLANLFQGNSENTPETLASDLKSATIFVRSPVLTVTLATSTSANVDAGDTASYTLTIENSGGATAYDIISEVPIVAGISAQSVTSATVDGSSVSPSGSLSDGTYELTSLAAGETYIISFDQTIASTAEPNDVITSSGDVIWSSGSGQTAFTAQTSDVSVTVSDIDVASTIISPVGNVVVGDTVEYQIDVTLPEGTTDDLTVDMRLPAGFEYTASSLAVDDSAFNGTVTGSPTITTSGTVASRQTVTAVFDGSTTTTNDNDSTNNTFSITLSAVVQDVNQNAATSSAQNKRINVSAGTNNTTNNASASSLNQFTEHVLDVTTTVTPVNGAEAGDLVTVQIEVENTGTASAFDVEVVSNINTDLLDLSTVIESSTESGFTYALQSNPTDRVYYSGTELASGTTATFVYTAEVKADAQSGASYDIAASATGDSQSGSQAVERSSDDSSTDNTSTIAISADTINLIDSSEAYTSDSATREAAIGEVLTYEFTTTVPEGKTLGTTDGDIIEIVLPAGMSFVSGTGLLRGDFDTSITSENGTSITTTNAAFTPTISGQSVIFDLGDLTNNDDDAGAETLSVTIDVLALNTSDNNRTENKTFTGQVNYLNESSVAQSANTTQNIRIAEPNLSVTKTASPSTVDGGSEVTFTVTLTNTSGTAVSRAYDWYISDDVPSRFNSVTLTSAKHSRSDLDISGCGTVSGNLLTIDSGDGNCPGTDEEYLAAGESIVVIYEATVDLSIGFEETVTNTVMTNATSLPGNNGTAGATSGTAGSDTGERTGSGNNNDSGQNVNDTAAIASASVTADSPTLTLILSAEDASIGTIEDIEASFSIPTGSTDDFEFELDLPAGLAYTGDAITVVTPLSDFTSSETPDTSPGAGTDPITLVFGTITNSADTAQAVTITIPVEVENILSNQTGVALTSTGSLSYDGVSSPEPSASADVNVVEPNLDLTQTITGGATASDSGDTVSYSTVIYNSDAKATAFAVNWLDVMPSELLGGPDGSGSGNTFTSVTVTTSDNSAVLTGTATTISDADITEVTTTNTGDTLSLAAFDLPPMVSVTITYDVVVSNTASAGEDLINAVSATYNSQLDETGRGASADSDDDDNSTLNNYRETTSSTLTVDNTLAVQSSLNTTHADNDFAIGESVSIDVRLDIVEGTIDNVSLVNTLPDDIRFTGISIDTNSQISYTGAATASESGNDITVDFGTISNTADSQTDNDFITVTFTGIVENEPSNIQSTTLTNVVNASGGGESAGPSNLDIDIVEPNLASTMTLDKSSVSLGDTFTLTIDVGHESSFADAYETTYNLAIPDGLTYISEGSVGNIDSSSPSLLVVDLGGINLVDAPKSVSLNFSVDNDADVGNPLTISLVDGDYSSVSGDTADERNYSFTDSINVTGDVEAFIAADQTLTLIDDVNGNGYIDSGDTVRVTSTLTNESADATANDVVFAHDIPANTTYVANSATTTVGTVDDASGIEVVIGDMLTSAQEVVTFDITINNGVADGTLVSFQGEVDSADTVSEPTDADANDANGDQANTFRLGVPAQTSELHVEQLVALTSDVDENDVISPDDTLTVTYIIENTGSDSVTDITLSDLIPTGLTYVANSAQISSSDTVSVVGSGISADLVSLDSQDQVTITLDVTVDSPLADQNGDAANETFVMQAQVASNEAETVNADSNGVSSDGEQALTFAATTGAGEPDLLITQSWTLIDDIDNDGIVDAGDSIALVTTALNQGAASAENVSFSQPIPTNTQVVADTGVTSQGAIISEAPFSVNIGNIEPGSTVTSSVVITVDSGVADDTRLTAQSLFEGDNFTNQSSDSDSAEDNGENATVISVTSADTLVSPATISLVDTSDVGTSDANFVQGETLTIDVVIPIPEGTTEDLVLQVTLPDDIALAANGASLSGDFTSAMSAANNPGDINNTTADTPVDVTNQVSVSGNQLTLNLGSVVNSDNDDDAESYTLSLVVSTSSIVPTSASEDLSVAMLLTYSDAAQALQTVNADDLTVTLLNRIPAANDDAFSVDEDTDNASLVVKSNDTDDDNGQLFTITSVGSASNGGTITTDGATLSYSPAPDFFGTETVVYTLTDSAGGADNATVTFTVANVEDAPVAENDTATTPEDTAVTTNVLANDNDVDGDTLSITSANATNGSATYSGSNITFTPNTDYNGPAAVTYVITDGNGNSDTATLNITVEARNDAPIANSDTANVDEDDSVTINALSNDSDADNDALSITAVSVDTGTVTVNGDGNIVYTPNTDYNGAATIEYTISDSNGGTDSAEVSVTVNAINDNPVANNDSGTVNEDESVTVDVLVNDTDVDGDTITLTGATSSQGATSISGGEITFTPSSNFNGSATITYTIEDGATGSDTGTLTINVVNVNDAPVAVNDAATTDEDTSVVIDALQNDTDIDQDVLSITAVSVDSGSVLVNGDGNIVYTPAADDNGSATITYTVSDGNDGTDTGTVNVTINAVNDDPVAVADTATVAEDNTVTINVLANDSDVDGDTLTLSSAVVTAGTVNIVAGQVVYTPDTNFNGTATITYVVSDGAGGEATQTAIVTVTAVNDAPVVTNDTAVVDEDNAVVINALANDSDVDEDALSITAVTASAGSAIVNGDGNVLYTPDADFNGAVTLNYTISDGSGGTDSGTIGVTVNAVNDDPVAVTDTATVAEDNAVTIDVLANDSDVDGDTITLSSAAVTTGTVNIVGGQLVYTPDANYNGTATITYVVSDGAGGEATQTAIVTVTAVNDAPVVTNDTAVVDEDNAVVINALANDIDVDEDALSITAVTASAGSAIVNGDGNVLYTPDADFNGAVTLNYTISDGNGGSDSGTIGVTVNAVNDAPVATADTATVAEDGTVTIDALANDTDVEDDLLSLNSASSPNGIVSIVANELVFEPELDFNGTTTITYSVSDGNGGEDTQTVTITVTAVNDAPVANDDAAKVTEDGAVSIPVLANDTDVDNDELSVTTASASEGTVSVAANGTLSYTPPADFDGAATITYSISDDNGGTDTGSVSITVDGVNDAPIAIADNATVDEDSSVTIAVLANDSDIDGDPLTVTAATSSQGTVSIDAAGDITFSPDADFNGNATISYTIDDGNGATDSAVVNVVVNPVNDNPVAENDTATVDEDTSVTIDVLLNDTDIDEDVLTLSDVDAAEGTASIQGGKLVYTPAENENGVVEVTYTVSDGNGGTATGIVSITINAINDAPTLEPLTAVTNQNEAVTVDVVAAVVDVDEGDTHTIVSAVSTDGVVTISDGVLTYTPSEDFSGTATIDVCVQDAEGEEACTTVTVTVTYTNIAPEVEDFTLTINEGDALPLALTGTDADDDELTYTLLSLPNGVILGGMPNVLFEPPTDFSGTAQFTYQANDGQEDSNVATVTIEIVPVNDAPVAINDVAETLDSSAVDIDVLANDTDVDDSTLTIIGAVADIGDVTIVDGMLNYVPVLGMNGDVQISYTIADASGAVSTATAVVTVSPADADIRPVVTPPADIEIDASGLFTAVDLGTATAVDSSGASLPVSLLNAEVRYAPGLHTVYWQAMDSEGNVTLVSQIIRVNPIVTISANQDVAEGAGASFSIYLNGNAPSYPYAIPFTVSGSAGDSDHDLVSQTVLIENGTQTSVSFNVLPDTDVEGTETVTVTLSDTLNVGANAIHTTSIVEDNVPLQVSLVASQDSEQRLVVSSQGGLVTIDSLIDYVNPGAEFTYDWLSIDNALSDIDSEDETFSFDPSTVAPGVYAISVTVTDVDSPNFGSEAIIYIEVVDSLPALGEDDTDNDGISDEDEGYNDADYDGIADYIDANAKCNLVPEIAAEDYHYMLEGEEGVCLRTGEFALVSEGEGVLLTADDIANNSDIFADNEVTNVGGIVNYDAASITLAGASHTVVVPQRAAIPADAILRKFSTDTGWTDFSEDGSNQVWSAPGAAGYCPSPQSAAWIPGLTQGDWCVQLVIEDGGSNDQDGVTNSGVSFVGGVGQLAGSNALPEAVDDNVAIKLDEPVLIDVLANDTDSDGDTLALTSVTADIGVVSIENGLVSYVPPENFVGTVRITYTISDGMGGTASAVLIITVAQNNAPVANDDTATVAEDSTLDIDVLSNDSDLDGDTLTVTEASASNGAVTILASGELSYSPVENFNGEVTVTYTIDDGHGGTNTAQVTITVTAVNDAPVAFNDSVSVLENNSVTIPVLVNDSDVDGDILTISMASSEHGEVVINAGTTLTFTPLTNLIGNAQITYTISDGYGGTDTAIVDVTIINGNDAPVAQDLTFTMEEDSSLPILLDGSDVDGDEVTYQLVSTPEGTLVGQAPDVLFVPTANFSGTTSFNYVVSDGQETSNTATVTINVTPINDAPVARDDSVLITQYIASDIDVLANDSDPDADVLRIIGASVEFGDVSWTDNLLTYTPIEGYVGELIIDYTIVDAEGVSATASVVVNINPDDAGDRPVVTIPDDVFIDANALFTKVDLGVASAIDKFGNPLPVSLVDGLIFYEPGNNTAFWQATDEDGLSTIASQRVRVRPLVSVTKDQTVLEGHEVEFGVHLNGTSPEYPLVVPYTVTGTADGTDHDLVDGTVVFESGSDVTVSFSIFPDGEVEGVETITITLSDTLNLGNKFTHIVTIREDNINPDIDLFAEQNSESRILIVPTGGDVVVTSEIIHPDPTNEYEYVWESLDVSLTDIDSADESFTFDPSTLEAGIYRLKATVTDIDDTGFSDSDTLYLQIVDELPVLGEVDTDGDGVPDTIDGLKDSDRDGIPDYLDSTPECNVLPQEVAYVDGYMVEGDPGVCLRLGNYSIKSTLGGAKVIDEDISADNVLTDDVEAINIGGIFDFIAYGLPDAGQSYLIVMPQLRPIPANAVYRKFTPEDGWVTFTEDVNNRVWSVAGEPGYCPPSGGDYWTEGLTEGHWCVQVEILDGGENDDDGITNGSIVDPGGVSVLVSDNSLPTANDDAVTVLVNETIAIDILLNDTDADGDVLYITSANVGFGTVTIDGDSLVFTPPIDFIGDINISYGISDGNGGTDLATVVVSVIGNSPPIAEDDAVTIDVDQSATIYVLDNDYDLDGDAIRVVEASASTGSVVVNPDDSITFTPPSGFAGDTVVIYLIEDTQGGTSEGRVVVTVNLVTVRVENTGGGR